jgi:subtilisin family serine protease
VVVAVLGTATPAAAAPPPGGFTPGELLVRFADRVDPHRRAATRDAIGAEVEHVLPIRNLELLRLRRGQSPQAAAQRLNRMGNVVYAEPNFVYRLASIPNDPRFGEQWALRNTGQAVAGPIGSPAPTTGVASADIEAVPAWDLSTGSTGVKLAIVDSGLRVEHPDFAGQVDHNYDPYYTPDAHHIDPNGHGTHVAGIAGARGGDGTGITGVAQRVSLMPLRVFGKDGSSDTASIAEALAYAGQHGVQVVNGSFSSRSPSDAISEAIRSSPGTLFVFAAGNSGTDMDTNSLYSHREWPCADTNPNVVCVGATDQSDRLTSWSNYGHNSVDIAAPGTNVLSTYPSFGPVFSDDFESSPPAHWTLSGWSPSTDWSTGGTRSLRATAAGCPPDAAPCVATLNDTVDIRNEQCRVHFDAKLSTPGPQQELRLEYKPDNGDSEWAGAAIWRGDWHGPVTSDLTWMGEQWALPIHFRFRLYGQGNETTGSAAVDNLHFDCMSTGAASGYETFEGTSMAAPQVAGAAALVYARFPGSTPAMVKRRLLAGADRVPGLAGTSVSGGRLNVYGALTASVPADESPPAGTITTVAGGGDTGYPPGDGGPATKANLFWPQRVRPLTGSGFLIADSADHRIRKVAANGTITTVAGTGELGFSGDGGPAAQAQIGRPQDAAPLPDGGFLVADTYNSRIRRVSANGTINTVAGTGAEGFTGDGGPATEAKIDTPTSVSPLAGGGFLFVDADNDRVRKVSASGVITTVAGNGDLQHEPVDGVPATDTSLDPTIVAATPSGGFLVVDAGHHRVCRVGPDGIIRTVAGTGYPGFAGDGGPATEATLDIPYDVSPTPDGGFLVSDYYNMRIRRVAPDGTIDTVAGGGSAGYGGDGGSATEARINRGAGVAALPSGGFLIADAGNARVRAVTASPAYTPPSGAPSTTTTRATAIGSASATLNATVYANRLGTSYRFDYGPTTAYGGSTSTSDAGSSAFAKPVSAQLSGLAPDTTYHFRVVAANSKGTGAGIDRTFQTARAGAPTPGPGPSPSTDPPAGTGSPPSQGPGGSPPATPGSSNPPANNSPGGGAPGDPGGAPGDPGGNAGPPSGAVPEPLRVRVAVVRALDRQSVLSSGLPVHVTCSWPCTLRGSLSLRTKARHGRPAQWLRLGMLSAENVSDSQLTLRIAPPGRRLLQSRRSALTRLRLVATRGTERSAVAAWIALRRIPPSVR